MARITTSIMIFLILANGAVTVMSGSGLTQDMGYEVAPSISDSTSNVTQDMREGWDPSTSIIESFVSLAISAKDIFVILIEGTTAAPRMFMNLGFPSWFVVPVFAPAYLITTVELLLLILGRSGEGI
jgi:hypothetical protein